MNFQQLTTFCTVLSEGSMTAAAEKLYLTQPAVSQQIRSLEDEMRVPLLVRGVRQVKATMQGQLLYDYAKKILNLTQQAQIAVHSMSHEISGMLRVGTLNSIGMYLISPVTGMFLRHNANLNIKLTYGSLDKIIEDMNENQIDVAILPDLKEEVQLNMEQFESRLLSKDEMWLVGSGRDTNLPEAIEIDEFVKKPVVVFSDMYPGFKKAFEQAIVSRGLEFMPVFESDNVGTLKRVVESGLGWGFLPAHAIRKQVRTRRLKRIDVANLKYSVALNLYVRRTEKMRQMGEIFYQAILQQNL